MAYGGLGADVVQALGLSIFCRAPVRSCACVRVCVCVCLPGGLGGGCEVVWDLGGFGRFGGLCCCCCCALPCVCVCVCVCVFVRSFASKKLDLAAVAAVTLCTPGGDHDTCRCEL